MILSVVFIDKTLRNNSCNFYALLENLPWDQPQIYTALFVKVDKRNTSGDGGDDDMFFWVVMGHVGS